MPSSERERELRRRRKRRKERIKERIREMIAAGKKGKKRPAKPKSESAGGPAKSEEKAGS